MAIKYWRESIGNDTTGDGSPGNPYKTIAKAILEAGVGGEVRHLGQAVIAISQPGEWTNGSGQVVFPGDLTGELPGWNWWIRPAPSAYADSPPYYVMMVYYSAGYTYVLLANNWYGTSGTYNSERLPDPDIFSTDSAQAQARQTFGFGYDSLGQQPAGYVSVLAAPSRRLLSVADGQWPLVRAEGRLIFLSSANLSLQTTGFQVGSGGIYISGRLIGAAEGAVDAGVLVEINGGLVYAEDILFGAGVAVKTWYAEPAVWIGRLVLSNGKAVVADWGSCPAVSVGRALERAPAAFLLALPRLEVGELRMTDVSGTPATSGVPSAEVRIGLLDYAGAVTYNGHCQIGAPVERWRMQTWSGTTTKVAGRGGDRLRLARGPDGGEPLSPPPVGSLPAHQVLHLSGATFLLLLLQRDRGGPARLLGGGGRGQRADLGPPGLRAPQRSVLGRRRAKVGNPLRHHGPGGQPPGCNLCPGQRGRGRRAVPGRPLLDARWDRDARGGPGGTGLPRLGPDRPEDTDLRRRRRRDD